EAETSIVHSDAEPILRERRDKKTSKRVRFIKLSQELVHAWFLCAAILGIESSFIFAAAAEPTFSDDHWVTMNPSIPGADGPVYATAVDDWGNLYIGGRFTLVGNVLATNIAKWNGSSWSPLGSGMDSVVQALAVSGSNVYAGGYFKKAGGDSANYVAKWDGNN